MKKALKNLSLAVLFMSGFSFAQTSPSDFENVGKEHNIMMEVIYKNFNEKHITNNIGNEIKTVSIEYINKNMTQYSEEDRKLAVKFVTDYVNSPVFYEGKLYNASLEKELSTATKRYLDVLNNIINDESLDHRQFETKVKSLEKEIVSAKLSPKEETILFSATNTAVYSHSYWATNYSKWKALDLARNGSTTMKAGPGPRIVGMDVAGGVGAAAGTWAVNVIPGAGQVAYGTAIVGGAVAGSAGQAVYELGSYFGIW